MNEKNTRWLFERYPRLYQGRFLGKDKNLMSLGFCCGDGWFLLVDQLSAAIEQECEQLRSQGWIESELPIATQVKEKLGLLRFRVGQFPAPPGIRQLIDKAKIDSEYICETSGSRSESGAMIGDIPPF